MSYALLGPFFIHDLSPGLYLRKAEQQHYKTKHEKQNNNITKLITKNRTTTLLNQIRKAEQQHYKTNHEKQNNNITKPNTKSRTTTLQNQTRKAEQQHYKTKMKR